MEFKRFTKKNLIFSAVAILLYLVWEHFIGGLRTDHFVMVAIYLLMYYGSVTTRKFYLGFSIFVIYWIIYDSMRVIPNYEISPVHIQQPYLIEKALFGINSGNSIITPNEYFVIHNNSFFDFLAGLFYVNWVPIPLMFAIYLFYKDKYLFVKFSLTFVIINVIGFICYYIYPAAPPWYVELYGFDLHLGVPGNSAGLARFDELVHIPVFSNIFNKNANVLAAMPSLHSVNPIIVLYYGIKLKLGKINWFFVLFMVGIWFSAVYTNHHYIIDVLAGIVLAVICLFVLERLMSLPKIDKMIIRFTKLL